ncbi:hypothetical protein [Allocoleopsis sp.]|uniref:hypothetical protein n=1 Tax=Allocoleopsis sp. TaxID=3088169 RepID=UPI002FCFDCE2
MKWMMNKSKSSAFLISAVVLACLVLAGCASTQHEWSHFKSNWFGLDRKITLYSADGRVIREWQGRYNLEVDSNTVRFIENGKAVLISGTFVVEEQ